MAEYHRHRRFRNVGRAIGHGVVNPFAQLTRFAAPPSSTTPISQSALQDSVFGMTGPSPTMRERPRTVSINSDGDVEMNQGMQDMGLSHGIALHFADGSGQGSSSGSDGGSRAVAVSSASTGGVGPKMMKETPITIQQHHFGLPETVTKVITQTSYISSANFSSVASGANPRFQVRLNTPYDWFVTALGTASAGGSITPGIYEYPIRYSNTTTPTWPSTLQFFPTTLTATERPQWREYFEKHYAYYAVLGCEYEITFMNPMLVGGCDSVIATYKDSYSATNATQVHPSSVSFGDMEQWPDVSFFRVPSTGDNDLSKAYKTIKGYYRPGSMKTSVENDEDMKTWTKVGSQPSLTELLTIVCGKSWDNNQSYPTLLNIRIDMRWIVQYKDIKNPFRWPHVGQTPITVAAPGDIVANP